MFGPYLLPDVLTGVSCALSCLPGIRYLQSVPIITHTDMKFLHGGAPVNFSMMVRHFPDCQIAHTKYWMWPINGLAYTLNRSKSAKRFVGNTKYLIYESFVDSIEDLIARTIVTAVWIQTTPGIFQ